MIWVKSHLRGLEVMMDEGIAKKRLLRQLEERVGPDLIFSHQGSFILPTSAVGEVLEILGAENVIWDEALLRHAEAQTTHRQLQLKAQVEVGRALEDPLSTLVDYRYVAQLDPHQVEAVAAITVPSLRGLALFDEQGSGKTIMALAAFDRLRQVGLLERMLVIAPKSVLGAWKSECTNFLGPNYRVVLVDGSSSKRHEAILRPHDVLLVSYDSAVRENSLLKMVVAAKPRSYMLVVDESYFVKNPRTARSRVISELRPFCERAIILCGTPAPNSPVDIVNQINIADGGVAFGGRSVSDDPQTALAEIGEGLGSAIYLRRLKEDVLPNIPNKQIEKVLLDLQPVQRALYARAYDELILAVRSVDDREFTRHLNSFLARRVALLQICSNPRSLDPLYTEVPAKLLALDKLIDELVERHKKKIVIWSFFRSSLEAIAARYQHFGLVRIDGSVSRIEDRVDAIHRFQNDPAVRIFVGNAAAAGAGITLTAAHHAIYESFSNQAAHYMQSVDRIHRRGQMLDVTYHVLLSRNTIEGAEFDRLLKKERTGRDLLGDHYKEPMTRERFLTELEALTT